MEPLIAHLDFREYQEPFGTYPRISALYPVHTWRIRCRLIFGARCAGKVINNINQNQNMKTKAVFYHAGCPVCVTAEQGVATALDRERFDVEIVHLGEQKGRLAEAENASVASVPALVIGGQTFHINHGADLSALKG